MKFYRAHFCIMMKDEDGVGRGGRVIAVGACRENEPQCIVT